MPDRITQVPAFRGEYGFLSNFYSVPIVYCGHNFRSTEHAFQWAAVKDKYKPQILSSKNDREAKNLAKMLPKIEGWHQKNLGIMKDLLTIKFENPVLREKLLNTGDMILEELNLWHDTFWGICNGVGENHLGRLLMEVRSEIKEKQGL